jgi:gamma-glutamylputrescine oxidase
LGYDDIPVFSPPSGAAENLTCQLLIAGGGLSGLSAAEAAMRQGVDVIVIEKGVFGEQTASALNAGQFLTGWAKPVDTMLAELAQQERERGLRGEQAQSQAQRRVQAFLRRTVEGCQRLSALDREYNLDASVLHGAAIAAVSDQDMASLNAGYEFMKKSNFSPLMPPSQGQRRRFYLALDARALQERCGTAEGLYAGGIIDFFGGSFEPRKLLHGLARSLQERGVRFFQNTEAQALDFADDHMTVFCGSGTAVRANTLFMANAYARHINGDIHERTIFTYNYVGDVQPFPRSPCTGACLAGGHRSRDRAYRRRPSLTPGRRLHRLPFCGAPARRTSDHICRAFGSRQLAGREGRADRWQPGRRFAAASGGEEDKRRRRREAQQLRLFEGFPKGMRLRPGMRYQEAAFPGPTAPTVSEP